MTGGREGVCDTSVKTADSGYVERKMMKNLESIS
jgi:DNA-directed RNA polymerase beta' subunit